MKIKFIILLILILANIQVHASEIKKGSNRGKLSEIPKFNIVSSAGCDTNYIFLATTSSLSPFIMIIDNSGEPIFWKNTVGGAYDFKPQPDGTLSYYDLKMDCFYILDKNYNLIDSIRCLNGVQTDIHELRILPNGNYLILGREDSHQVDLSGVVDGGRTSATIISYVIQEIDKNKNLVFEWNTWDNFEITDTYSDLKQGTIDVSHGNSIEIDFDGNFLVSFRNTQEITKIDRATGEIIWRLGGKKNQFTFINDTLGFSWQHAARRLPNGNIMLFDNGFRREPAVMAFSRALEYKVDEINKTATLVWEYRNTPDVYSIGLGYSQKLPNGNAFIAWGAATPAITEVTPNKEEVFELSFIENLSTYRAYRFPWNLQKVENGLDIISTIDKYNFSVNKMEDTASVEICLINRNSFDAAVTSITNDERTFYIPFEFPAQINKGDSLKFRIYFRPNLSGQFIDTLKITTNINELFIPLSGNVTTGLKEPDPYLVTDFSLQQNYPNPFNPSTTISYTISQNPPISPLYQRGGKGGFVTLKVYDILGREVATLVNEYQQPGKYSVQFNVKTLHGASLLSGVSAKGGYASGIYFYKLSVDNKYSVVRKMILLK
ncbi:MAG: aryl-sulfate sulfotransferase [Bacteroidota bacterium]